MDERATRIVETAIELAERDGYAAVRLRDVAKQAGVALGTVYKRFRSKEEILVAAMTREGERLISNLAKVPAGDTPMERIEAYFRAATDGFCSRPKLAKAMLRAIASGDTMTAQIASLHGLTTAALISAISGVAMEERERWGGEADRELREVASILQQVWFAALIGWAGGIRNHEGITEQVTRAAERLLQTLDLPS